MNSVMRRIRGALGMGLVWGIGAGMIGGLIELLDNLGVTWSWIAAVDMWPQALAIPGLLCGVFFSILLGILARDRRIDELSVPGVAGLGGVGGVLLAGLIFLVEGGGSTLVLAAVAGVLGLFSATSATATILLARMATDRDALPPGE